MTTRLSKPVTRAIEIDGRPWTVTLGLFGVTFREFRRHKGFLLPYGSGMVRAVTLYVEQQRREKVKARKLRRGAL